MKIQLRFLPLTVIVISLSALFLPACGGKSKSVSSEPYVRSEGMVWNTEFHVTYQGSLSLRDSVIEVFGRIGKSLSVFDTASLVSRVNRQDSTPVNDDFIRVYVMARKISKLSDGAFDPTISPLITAWSFGPGHKATADTARIDSIRQFVGIRRTRLSHDALIKEDIRTEFNFSALAKGYGCDEVGAMFRRNGVENFLIEVGGEIYASGHSERGSQWNISVDAPVFSDSVIVHESQCVISFTDMGVATSGNYRNFRREGSRTFGHIISTSSGRPAETDILSATVLAPTAMEADALATAFMAMGSARSIELNKRLHLPVMIVMADSVWKSREFERLESHD